MRGKARVYSEVFELAWKAYPRKQEKGEAYGQWLVEAKRVGSETLLLTLIQGALRWQIGQWSEPKFAPYFERYLRKRKWEDEPLAPAPPPADSARARARAEIDHDAAKTDEYLAKLRPSGPPITADQLAALRAGKAGT